jgi:integrase
VARYKVRVKTPEGKWLTKQTPTLSLAKKVELKFQSQSVLEGIGVHKAPLLDVVWKAYLKHAKAFKKSWKDDESRWTHHVTPALPTYKALKMDKVTPTMIQSIVNSMNTTHKPATIKQVRQLVNRIYNFAIKQRLYYGANPCQSVSIPKFDNRVTENLTQEEIERLMAVLAEDSNKRAALVVLFALYTGKRRSEILRLTWQDIDWKSGLVTFRNTKNTETHTIPVNEKAMGILKQAHEIQKSDLPDDLVFPCDTGKYYHSFDRTWRRIRKKAGLTIRLHGLRHVYASWLASSGKVDLFVLKELLGHKDVKMTMRYSHIMNAALKNGCESLEFESGS